MIETDPLPIFSPPADALAAMIPPAQTALLVIDVQRDFVAQNGVLGGSGIDMSVLAPALDKVEALLGRARAAGVLPVLVRVVTRSETDTVALRRLYQRKGYGADGLEMCRAGTAGIDYVRIAPRSGELQIEKTLYSAFHATGLADTLRQRGIDSVVTCGFTSECCVEATARDALEHGFDSFVVADACAAYAPEMHRASMQALALNYSLLLDTDSVMQAWGGTASAD